MNLKKYWQFNNGRVLSTLRDVSLDDSKKEYMTESMAEVINFDLVKREYMNDRHMSEDEAKSIDALFQVKTTSKVDPDICMVEFKNGTIEKRDIERKARDSVLIYQSITNTQLEDTRENVRFVLVYNGEMYPSNYRNKRADKLAANAKVDYARFGLAHLRGFCFKEVEALEKKEFEKRIASRIRET